MAAGIEQAERIPVARAPAGRNLDFPDAIQVVGGDGFLLQEFFRPALSHHAPAFHAGARPHVHDIVGRPHHVLVVFHHDDGIAQVPQLFEGSNQPLIVALVQPDAGFVQDIQHPYQFGPDLGRQADTLGFPAG